MKRMLSRMLAVALCLCTMLTTAIATDAIVVQDEKTGYQNISSTAVVGDTVYLLRVSGEEAQLLAWRDGMSQAEAVASGLAYAPSFNSLDQIRQAALNEGAAADAEHAVSRIFTDGEKLYAINHFNGLIFAVSVTREGLVYEDAYILPDPTLLYDPQQANFLAYMQPDDAIKVGDWLLWYGRNWGNAYSQTCVMAFNLVTGAAKQAVLPRIQTVATYKNGKILVVAASDAQNAHAILTYDPQTDLTERLGALPPDVLVHKVAYSAALDMLVYQDKTRIMGWTAEGGAEQLGFIPTRIAARSALAVGDKLLYSTYDNSGITAMTLEKGYAPEHSLSIMGGTMTDVVSRFSLTYQGVPFYYTAKDAEEKYTDVLAREKEAPDLIKLTVSDGDYAELLAGGYLMDLSGSPEIKAYADVLYPTYKNLVTKDGGIYAVPVNASSYNGWYINKEVMNGLGLTAADVPTSLTELCAFATRWNNEFAEKYPHYTLLNNTTEYRERLLEVMLREWSEYCQFTGRELNHDDPIFRELLAALDAAELDKLNEALKQTNPEVSEYKQALIWTGVKDVGNFATYREEFSDRIFIPLTLTPDTPYTAAVDTVQVWVVNAKSNNAEYAVSMLNELIKSMNGTGSYVLRTDRTEPVINEYYAESLAHAEERLAVLEARVEDSVNKATALKRVEEQKVYINTELARTQYTINASAIEHYQQVIAPASYVHMPDALTVSERSDAVTECINAYLDKACTAEEFITRLNSALKAQ